MYSKFLWILILMSSPAFLQVIHRSFPIKYIVQVPVVLYTLRDWYYLTQHRFSLMSSVFSFRLDMVTSQLFFYVVLYLGLYIPWFYIPLTGVQYSALFVSNGSFLLSYILLT
jgi:hypothetical protein